MTQTIAIVARWFQCRSGFEPHWLKETFMLPNSFFGLRQVALELEGNVLINLRRQCFTCSLARIFNNVLISFPIEDMTFSGKSHVSLTLISPRKSMISKYP